MTLKQKLRLRRERKKQAQARNRLIALLDNLIVNWNPQFVDTADLTNSVQDNLQLSRKLLNDLKEARTALANMLFADSAVVWDCASTVETQLNKMQGLLASSTPVLLQGAVDEIKLALHQWANL